MNLKEMTSEALICLDVNYKTKEDIIDALIEKMYSNGNISSKEEYKKAVYEREALSPTGFEQGIAIPHGKSNAVKKACFAFARLTNPVNDWESLQPDNKVSLVFLLAIPSGNGNEHLKLLSTLSQNIMEDSFIKNVKTAKTAKELIANLDVKESNIKKVTSGDTVLAITACAAGIAHTYMAAKALEQAGQEMGVNVYVEKQGANGIEDEHTSQQIKNAKAVIFACDITPKNTARYNGLNYVSVKVAEPIKDPKAIINKALNNPDGIYETESEAQSQSKGNGVVSQCVQAVMTGISYMIPMIVAAGLMMGIAKLVAVGMGNINDFSTFLDSGNPFLEFLYRLDQFGGLIFKFIYPVFAAYTAYAIADRPGIVPGFVGGVFAAGLHYTFWGIEGGIPSGFLGALFLGIVAGYIAKFLNTKIKLHKNLNAVKPMLLVPGITVFLILVLNLYIVDPIFGGLNNGLANWIGSFDTTSTLLLTSIIAACTAFDLGGPVNKAAGAIAMGLAADLVFPLTGRVLSIVIPPIGIGIATVIDKYVVGRRVFDDNERVLGTSSIILGLIAVSEGAIPFMLKNPLITIPINILGAIIGSSVAVVLGAVQWNPLPAIWGWPLVENLPAYLVGLVCGVLFIALANILVRNFIIKKNKK